MVQTTTLYKAGMEFMEKEYTIKLQSCSLNSQTQDTRTTIARGKINLAKYCTVDEKGIPKPPEQVQDVVYLK